jgi:hypothetical protein
MTNEVGRAADAFGVSVGLGNVEYGRHYTQLKVDKWDVDQISWIQRKDYDDRRMLLRGQEPDALVFMAYRCLPFETFIEEDCNLIVDAGWQMLMNGIAGSAVTKFASGTGRIGGGITGTAAAYTNTDLLATTGAANRQWEVLNAVPTVGSTHTAGLVVAATFPTTDGNFAWAEFGLDSGTTAGTGASVAVFFSRGVASPGTKTSAQTWNATITYTWT